MKSLRGTGEVSAGVGLQGCVLSFTHTAVSVTDYSDPERRTARCDTAKHFQLALLHHTKNETRIKMNEFASDHI